MKLRHFWEGIKYRFWGNPFEGLFSEESMRRIAMERNRPTIGGLKRALKQFRETKDENHNKEAVIVLLRFRIVMSDYRFEKLLKDVGVSQDSAIKAMASVLDFTPAEKGEKQWHGQKM